MLYKHILRLDGGVINVSALEVGEEALNMLRDGQNIRTRTGMPVGRLGSIQYSDFSAHGAIVGRDIGPLVEYRREYDLAGNSAFYYTILYSIDSDYYYVEPEDDPDGLVTISTSMNSGDFFGVNIFDYMFIATGKDPIWLYDGGSAFIRAGIVAPAAMTNNGINPVPGVPPPAMARRYKYTYYADVNPMDKESEASTPLTQTGLGDTAPIGHTYLYTQATDPQVTHYKFYATEFWNPITDSAETEYYLMGTKSLAQAIADGFVFTDSLENDTLTLNAAYDTTKRGVPPEVKYLLWHEGVLYGAGEEANPSVLYYSIPTKPFYFDPDDWEGVSRDDGDIITGLAAIGRTRFIFKKNSIWQWTGDPSSAIPITAVERPDASMNMTRLGVGCADPRSLASWLNSLIFRATDGHVYLLDRERIVQLSMYVPDWMDNLSDDAISCVYEDYYIIKQGLFTYVCDLRKDEFGWQGRDFPVAPNYFLIDHLGRCLGSLEDGIVQYYTGTTDLGAVISKEFQGPYVRLALGDVEASVRELIVEDRNRNDDYTAYVYNEDSTLLNTGAYPTTLRKFFVGGGRGNYASPRLAWTGNANPLQVSIGYIPVRRH